MTINYTAGSPIPQGITGGTTAVFSMKQAAEVAGISVSTLRRRRSDLVAAGADISPEGWKVPMTALVACGLIAGEGPQPVAREVPVTPRLPKDPQFSDQAEQLEELTTQVRDLEREVAEWRRRAEVAEARAEERGHALDALRLANETERMALRMLTAGSPTAPTVQSPEEPALGAEAVDHRPTVYSEMPQEERGRKGFFSRVMGL
jgi:hypothetical protein